MDSISPVYLLLGAIICSMIGRFMLIRAAWEISKAWGIAVLCVPLAPMFFRMNYKELAGEGKNWLRATSFLFLCYVGLTGSRGSLDDLWQVVPERFRPQEVAEHQVADSEELVAETEATETSEDEGGPEVAQASISPHRTIVTHAVPSAPAEKKSFFARIASLIHSGAPEPAKPAAVTTAATLTPPAPTGPTLAERVAANQQEFARLGEVYETLKKERGYLKKSDQDSIKAYNEQAAKYQADLAKARADQVELNKQAGLAKK